MTLPTRNAQYLARVEIRADEEVLQPKIALRLLLFHEPHRLRLPQNGPRSVQLPKLYHFQHDLPQNPLSKIRLAEWPRTRIRFSI